MHHGLKFKSMLAPHEAVVPLYCLTVGVVHPPKAL